MTAQKKHVVVLIMSRGSLFVEMLFLKTHKRGIRFGIINMDHHEYKERLLNQFLTSVAAVNPAKLVADNLKLEGQNLHACGKVYNLKNENVYLIGFGKAVLEMASQCEKILGQRLKRGVICIPENMRKTNKECGSVIEVYEGARNNLPDENAEKGADEIIKLVQSLPRKQENYFVVLISGGGSALFTKPKTEITLAEKLQTIKQLASSGADITEMNLIRKKLSKVKGGGLAAMLYPTTTICLILSDVVNDPIDVIASGPTVPNLNLGFTAFDVIKKYNLENKLPENVLNLLKTDNSNVSQFDETFPHVHNYIIGNNLKALNAGKEYMEACGFKTVIMSRKVVGLVENISDFYLNMVLEIMKCLHHKVVCNKEKLLKDCHFDCEENFTEDLNRALLDSISSKKICVMAGGETTVRLQGDGKGGRNQELALLVSVGIYDLKTKYPHLFDKYGVMFFMAGTDGIDGPTDVAGAMGDASIIEKARKSDLNVKSFLLRNDSYNFFQKIDNGAYFIKTGHTGTNVMDLHSFLIYEL